MPEEKTTKSRPRIPTIRPHQFVALDRFIRYLSITVKEERYISGKTLFPPLATMRVPEQAIHKEICG